jgi:predicted RND superfamily exporter protein
MDEILELRKSINEGRYADALHIIDELEEMAKDDKLDKIFSYMQILLIHLIKQNAEQRTTRSWDNSIKHSLYKIERVNKRRKYGGDYMNTDELFNNLAEAFVLSLDQAAEEAFEGIYSSKQLLSKIDKNKILAEAMEMIEKHK